MNANLFMWSKLQVGSQLLTNLPLDNMATILADGISKCIFLNEIDRILIQNFTETCPRESNWQ